MQVKVDYIVSSPLCGDGCGEQESHLFALSGRISHILSRGQSMPRSLSHMFRAGLPGFRLRGPCWPTGDVRSGLHRVNADQNIR